jgi:hypothetical protein
VYDAVRIVSSLCQTSARMWLGGGYEDGMRRFSGLEQLAGIKFTILSA